MAKNELHWLNRKPDPNIRECKPYLTHTDRPRISSSTILKLLTLKSELNGTKLDVLAEAEKFELQNNTI